MSEGLSNARPGASDGPRSGVSLPGARHHERWASISERRARCCRFHWISLNSGRSLLMLAARSRTCARGRIGGAARVFVSARRGAVTRAAWPHMRAAGYGRAVSIEMKRAPEGIAAVRAALSRFEQAGKAGKAGT